MYPLNAAPGRQKEKFQNVGSIIFFELMSSHKKISNHIKVDKKKCVIQFTGYEEKVIFVISFFNPQVQPR